MMTLKVITMSEPPWAKLTQRGSERARINLSVHSRGQSGM